MTTTIIPFEEIISGATVRFTVIGGVQFLSIRDLIMVMCDKTNKDASQTWIRDITNEQKAEISSFCRNFQFPGRGQSEQPVIQFQGAMKLLMWLPGENAKKFRSQAADILTRYYAGDTTLLSEINADSHDVINQAARAADNKRKALELDIQEEALQTSRIERHLKAVTIQTKLMDMYTALCPDNVIDDRTRLHFKDIIINLSSSAAGKAITNGDVKSPNAPLTISTVAAELGLRFTTDELKCVGAKISKLYRAKNGSSPPKHEQQCDGAVRLVCSYSECDRDVVEQALREFRR
jgi:hypothetical protein